MSTGYKFSEAGHLAPPPPPKPKPVIDGEDIRKLVGAFLVWWAVNSLIYIGCAWQVATWGWDGEHSVRMPGKFDWWQPEAILVLFILNLGVLGIALFNAD